MYTHIDTHLGTKPNFHYIKMQQSTLVVKDYLLVCFAVTCDKIFMGKNAVGKICLPYWENGDKDDLRVQWISSKLG